MNLPYINPFYLPSRYKALTTLRGLSWPPEVPRESSLGYSMPSSAP